jgi:hypothetical protein
MIANEILKATKKPTDYVEACELKSKIIAQRFAEQEAIKFHKQALLLRIEIQQALGFSSDEYYQFLLTVK